MNTVESLAWKTFRLLRHFLVLKPFFSHFHVNNNNNDDDEYVCAR